MGGAVMGSGVLRWMALVGLVLSLPACTLVQLREQAREFEVATVLVGRVTPPAGWWGPVVVAALAEHDGVRRVVHQVRLHEPGGYELIVPDGRYTLLAYGDRDGDGRPAEPDPAAVAAAPVEVSGSGMVMQLDLPLAPQGAAVLRGLLPADAPPPPRHSTQAGALASLADEVLSAGAGRQGYWAPMEAFRRTGGNIHFTEPYDPARIPVLFVHGAVGSAQDWRHFIDQLDRRRYQAWLFQYPSGAALDSMAHLLYWKLLNLQQRHHFERLHLVAHSMGGLVVRRMLLDHGAEFPARLETFVSLSTPWNGEASAVLGVQHSPAVVPSWRDMQPGGPFLTALYQRPLPPRVQHLLLFGHRGGYSLLQPTSDGTVTLASQLRPQAQAEARLVLGFDEDHTSILAAPQVIAQVQRLLDDAGAAGPPGGRLQVRLKSPEGGDAAVAGLPMLWLVPDEPAGGTPAPPARPPLLLPLAAGDGAAGASGAPTGPVPPGRYLASPLVSGYRGMPARQPVVVTPGGLQALDFTLLPQGQLYGYVGADGDALARPAGSWRPPHASVRVQRIRLQGPGIDRVLVPRREGPADVLQRTLDGLDDAVGPHFCFVDLPAGDYRLTLEAEGRAPHVSRHRVVPGLGTPLAPIVLHPLR